MAVHVQAGRHEIWVGLGVSIISIPLSVIVVGFFSLLGVSIWAIIDAATKSNDFYLRFPNG